MHREWLSTARDGRAPRLARRRLGARYALTLGGAALVAIGAGSLASCNGERSAGPGREVDASKGGGLVASGRDIFRFDTFGDEQFWTDTLRMHEVIQAAVTPSVALSVGLKVDADALPPAVKDALAAGQVDLNSTATTLALLELNAVVGVKGDVQTVNGRDTLVRVGITCALCHSMVDNSFAPGIGRRLDGWANTTLNPGAIVALSPALTDAQRAVYSSWGVGRYDPRFNIDGLSTPIVLPPAYGLRGVDKETFTGEGPVSYWNAYVAVTQMHGQGSFSDPRLGIDIVQTPDLVTPKLAALREYQLSLNAPRPPAGVIDRAAAGRGRAVFVGAGRCASCHVGSRLTDVNSGTLHAPSETGMDPRYAARTTQKAYRTTPLRGLLQHPPYFHDGSAATLGDVVAHYERVLALNLTEQQRRDLVEYLKSL
jgi:mono/diheme cytochrome c family protein